MDHPAWVLPFLTNLERTGNKAKSARLAGVSSKTVYALKAKDADFAAAWEQAEMDHTEKCEEELTRRAFGYEEPVVYQGQLTPVWERDQAGQIVMEVYGSDEFDKPMQRPVQARNDDGSLKWLTVTKFSDTLLLARVKAYNKRYSTDRTELTGADGGDLRVLDSTVRDARVAAIMARAAERKQAQEFGDLA